MTEQELELAGAWAFTIAYLIGCGGLISYAIGLIRIATKKAPKE